MSIVTWNVRRVNYQDYVWIHLHENNPELPKLEESGWQLGAENMIEYNWCKDTIVPQELIEILFNIPDEEDINDDYEGVELTSMTDIVYEEDSDNGD